MQLNKMAEVSVHGQAADVEWHLQRNGPDDWQLEVQDTTEDAPTKVFVLKDDEASATMALFIGEMAEPLNAQLYEIAERVWKDVPNTHRIIP